MKSINWKWFYLSALTAVLLLSATSKISHSIGSFPFLWLLPLALYLLSFVIAFSGVNLGSKVSVVFFISLLAIWITQTFVLRITFLQTLFLYSSLLISAFLFCHAKLYTIRPDEKFLDLYYLVIAFGGAVGGVVVSILAPTILKDYWEFDIVLILIFFLVVREFIMNTKSSFISKVARNNLDIFFLYAGIVLSLALAGYAMPKLYGDDVVVLSSQRNFYGTAKILQKYDIKYLQNGKIIHGLERQNSKESNLVEGYYGSGTAVEFLFRNTESSKRVGVIGLGVGMILGFATDTDEIDFYEIDPKVIAIARNEFSYMKKTTSKVNVVLGDARISLEKVGNRNYDFIIIDAFSDDAIPVHLLTKEAFQIYLHHLSPQGSIAVHITNRYIDLSPVLANLAQHNNISIAFFETDIQSESLYPSRWALLTRNNSLLEECNSCEDITSVYAKAKKIPLWTDDFSNIFQILK